MMKRYLMVFLAGIFILGLFNLFPQYKGNGKLKGIVTDMQGNPLKGVKVKLFSVRAGGGFERVTNAKGEWKAFWIRGGQWNLDFEKIGYEPRKQSTNIAQDGKVNEVETKLKKMEGISLTKDLVKELEKGNDLFRAKKYDEAMQVYQKMLTDNPEAYILNQNIANCYFEKKEYEKAIEHYKKVLESDPKHTGALVSIGNSYSNMGKSEKAIETYKKIDVTKLSDPIVLYNIGIFYFNAGKTKEAVYYLERCVKVDENNIDGLYQLGLAYMGENRNKEAMVVLEKLIAAAPESDKATQAKEILNALKQYVK